MMSINLASILEFVDYHLPRKFVIVELRCVCKRIEFFFNSSNLSSRKLIENIIVMRANKRSDQINGFVLINYLISH